jgi:hypothetical protein
MFRSNIPSPSSTLMIEAEWSSSTLKMYAACSSETSVSSHKTTRSYNRETIILLYCNMTLQRYLCSNSDKNEDYCLRGHDVVQLGRQTPPFRRNLLPNKPSVGKSVWLQGMQDSARSPEWTLCTLFSSVALVPRACSSNIHPYHFSKLFLLLYPADG